MWSKSAIVVVVVVAQTALAVFGVPLTSRNPASILYDRSTNSVADAAAAAAPAPVFACAASSWPPNTIGKANEPQQPSADLAAILAAVDPKRIEATIRKLVSFGTRHTLSTQNSTTRGIGAARDWIHSEYQRYADASDGRLSVRTIGYVQQPDGNRVLFPTRISDVVATLKGSEEGGDGGGGGGGRVYVVSGHYDSRNSDVLDYVGDAPGADDDASGVAVALELARVMADPRRPVPKASIAFVAVAGEEQGLYGAQFLAQTYANSTPRVNVEGMLNNDIVGSPNSADPHVLRLFGQGLPPLTVEDSTKRESRLQIGGENDTPARNLARFVKEVAENSATGMNVSLIYRLDRYLRSGDHRPFLENGYPAVRFTEPREDFAHQHQNVRVDNSTGVPVQYGDLPEFVDFEFVARVARVNGAALWSLAMSPGMPTNVRVDTEALTNESTLLWDPPPSGEEGVASYEVVWRPTSAPAWTDVIDVGLVNQVTLNLSKDNVVFGVRAKSADGSRGVAVLSFPA